MAASSSPSPRQFDVAVLGATGFTGCRVLKELISQILELPRSECLQYPLRVAAGGRSAARVRAQLADLGLAEGDAHAPANISASAVASVSTAASSTSSRARDGAASTSNCRRGAAGAQGGSARLAVVEVDVLDPASVSAFCHSTRLVLNCVGPFRFYGRPVVAGCVEAGTDYLDVTGEPQFMEHSAAEFSAAAAAGGSLVVSACGFDSVPAELGVQASLKVLGGGSMPPSSDPGSASDPDSSGAVASVSSYLTVSAPLGLRGHFGTWDSLVHSLASVHELRKLRKRQSQNSGRGQRGGSSALPPGKEASSSRQPGKGRSGGPSMLPRWSPVLNAYVLPFPGADASVVRRTLAHAKAQRAQLRQPGAGGGAGAGAAVESPAGGEGSEAHPGADVLKEPLLAGDSGASAAAAGPALATAILPAASFEEVKYSACFTLRTAFQVGLFLGLGSVLALLAGFDWGRFLLLRYPELFSYGVFSRAGPTAEQLEATTFTMRFDAERVDRDRGAGSGSVSPSSKATLVVQGPELGYVVTPWIIVQCGLTLLSSRSLLPRGGVLTPAVAFAGTDLQQALQDRGMRFEVLE